MADFNISEKDFTSEILKLSELCEKNGIIDSSLIIQIILIFPT